jgi:hypothetical protein
MKHISSLLLMIGSITAHAQLLMNPSFENGFGGDLNYWVHQCIAQTVAEAAPSSGNWCAEVEASNPQGCFGASIYQVVPDAYPGMPFTLGGWCRNTTGPWAPTIGFDIGVMDTQGNITLMQLGLTTTDTNWTWLGTDDTLQMSSDDQAVVVCNSGFVGGPGFALSRFDGIQFFENFPFSIGEGPVLNSYCDSDGGYLVVNCSNAPITNVRLLDVSGRSVLAPLSFTNTNTTRISIAMLPPGIYLATVYTGRGVATTRFVADR